MIYRTTRNMGTKWMSDIGRLFRFYIRHGNGTQLARKWWITEFEHRFLTNLPEDKTEISCWLNFLLSKRREKLDNELVKMLAEPKWRLKIISAALRCDKSEPNVQAGYKYQIQSWRYWTVTDRKGFLVTHEVGWQSDIVKAILEMTRKSGQLFLSA